MVVTLTGNNAHALSARLAGLVIEFAKKYGELAIERIDAEEAEGQAILDAVTNLPFLSEKKMVVVRNPSANKEAANNIEQIISSIHDGVELILVEPITDKRTLFYKILSSKTSMETFDELTPPELAEWLVDETKDQGGEIIKSDANYLIERLGQNQAQLANEIAKLITYEPKITRANIDLLTVKTPQGRVFDLLDAAFAGNKTRALELYAQQRAQKVEPQEIMSMLAWQLRLIAACALAGPKSSTDIAKDLGMSSFPVMKAQNLAKKINLSKLKELVFEATALDLRGKSASIELDEALKTYITTI